MYTVPFSRLTARLAAHRALTAFALLACAALAQAGEAARVFHAEGDVRIANRPAKVGDAVAEGDQISTGADGYIYMKTVDDGMFVLRPRSSARIVTYHIDAADPRNTRIKFELLSGVARSRSGHAVKAARQNFRFNTPVAAIGVRGTDFTVFTDAETSRVSVLSGGIVVSGFGGSCSPDGTGPCEGTASRELMATQVGQMLQVRRGQNAPQLMNGGVQAPDVAVPPKPDEPPVKALPAPETVSLEPRKTINLLQNMPMPPSNPSTQDKPAPPSTPDKPADPVGGGQGPNMPPPIVTTVEPPVIPPVEINPPGPVLWGRWAALADRPATLDLTKQGGAEVVALNSQYAVLRAPGGTWQAPERGSIGFVLRGGDANIRDEAKLTNTAATLENGKLNIDFAAATFSTSFDLVSDTQRYQLQALGSVARDGGLAGAQQFSPGTNMAVSGLMGPENGGTAAYIFQSRLDPKRVATGVTYWTK